VYGAQGAATAEGRRPRSASPGGGRGRDSGL